MDCSAGSALYRCCTTNCGSCKCTACGGPSGVVCDVCAAHYCPHCWMAGCADSFVCVYLCDACARALPDDQRAFAVSIEPLTDGYVTPAGPATHRVVFGGARLLELFKASDAYRVRVLAAGLPEDA